MQFNSYEFIFYFLLLTLVLYLFANKVNPVFGKIIIRELPEGSTTQPVFSEM